MDHDVWDMKNNSGERTGQRLFPPGCTDIRDCHLLKIRMFQSNYYISNRSSHIYQWPIICWDFPSNTTLLQQVPSDMLWIALFPQRSVHRWPLRLETDCQHSPPAELPLKVKARLIQTHMVHSRATCVQVWNTDLQIKNVEVCVKWLRECWRIGLDLEQHSRSQSSGPTLLLGCPCDGVLEGFAAGAVSSTHSTFILLLRGAEHTIAAHFLFTDGWKVSFIPPEQQLLSHSDTGRLLTSHSPRTHTLWGSLYEHRVPSRTTWSVRATARVSLDWQCRLQRLLAARQTQQWRFLTRLSIQWAQLWFSEQALSESAWLCVAAWVSLEVQEPLESKPVRPAPPE